MEIAEIKNHLKKYKITYGQLSEQTGLNLTTVKRIFSGQIKNPHIETVRAIEQALGFIGEQTTVPMRNIFSSEEQDIINDYRLLNAECQRLVKDTIKTLLISSAGNAQNKNRIS